MGIYRSLRAIADRKRRREGQKPDNPVARDVGTLKYRQRIVPDKREKERNPFKDWGNENRD